MVLGSAHQIALNHPTSDVEEFDQRSMCCGLAGVKFHCSVCTSDEFRASVFVDVNACVHACIHAYVHVCVMLVFV